MKSPSKFIRKKINIFSKKKKPCVKKSSKPRKKFNKTAIIDSSLLKNEITNENEEKDEISFLSNANLNVIRILTNCANEDIINKSSFIDFNNDNKKELSSESRRQLSSCKGSPIINYKNNNLKKKNILNLSDFSSDSIHSEKLKYNKTIESKKSIFRKQKKFYNDKEKISENKSKEKISFEQKSPKKLRHYSTGNEENFKHRFKKINSKNYESSINHKNKLLKHRNSCFINNQYMNEQNLYYPKNNVPNFGNNYISEIEIMKINENIQSDINFIQLKKKISKLKKSIRLRNNKSDSEKTIYKDSLNNIHPITETDENSEDISSIKDSKVTSEKNSISNKCSKEIINISTNKNNRKDKFRLLLRKNNIYDSFDDEEYKYEEIGYYISPTSWYIRVFDSLLFISSIIYLIYVPYLLSHNFFIDKGNKFWENILIIIDIIYIIDVIINFFKAYQNYDEHLIRRKKAIFFHYLKTWFLLDFIQSIPLFSIFKFLRINSQQIKLFYLFNKAYDLKPNLYILVLIKVIKVYKMFNDNSTIIYFSEILSTIEILDDYGNFIINIILSLCCLNMVSCLFIFFGKNSYPNWIIKLNIQDESYLKIYLTSMYFIIVTITTVGYGDITGNSISEIQFQLLLLIIGTIAYSFIISYISNYIIKINKKSMSFEKNMEILQEIKLHHPNMKNSIYNEVLRNLYNEQLYEKKDKHILLDCLPYSLKNKLIMEMYKPIIKKFIFFKDIDNSDFIAKVATSLKPIITIKGDIVIEEGDYIKEIFFVKKGIISLYISIDLNEPEISLKKYFGQNDIGKYDISNVKSKIINPKNKSDKISFDEQNLSSSSFNIEKREGFKNIEKIEDIKIIEIRNNEHFGDALMFLNERSPLVAKVRTNSAELLILRKIEAIEIYSIYPNIWKRINKKSLYNMEQIYKKIKKVVIELSHRYNIKIGSEKLNRRRKSKKHKNNKRRSEEEIEINNNKENKTNDNNNIEINKTEEEKKDFKNEIKPNIVEFEEMNTNTNIDQGSNKSEIMSFFKNKVKEKESTSTLHISKFNLGKKESSNLCFLENSNNNLSKLNEDLRNKNRIMSGFKNSNNNLVKSHLSSNSLSKLNKQYKEKDSSVETQNDNFLRTTNIHSTIMPKLILSDNSQKLKQNNNPIPSSNSQRDKNSTKEEKILYNAFINLSIMKEKNFQINSSYENINKISHDKFIKDKNLQSKTKNFIINECAENRPKKKNSSFLKLLDTPKHFHLTYRKNSSKINSHSILSDSKFDKNSLLESSRSNHKNKSFNKNSDSSLSDSSNKKEELMSNSKLLKINKFTTSQNLIKIKKFKSSNIEENKIKKKKTKNESKSINKKLNIISNNIKNSSRIINNPMEFYMDFFNNIIRKESHSNIEEPDVEKDNNIRYIKAKSKSGELNISLKSHQIEKKIIDSITSSGDKNRSMNKSKIMQK